MKGNACPDRMNSHSTGKSFPACSSLTLPEFANVMHFCLRTNNAQLQQAAVHLEGEQREEKELERILTQRMMKVKELQAGKQRLEEEQQRVLIVFEPTLHTGTQTDAYLEACPADATVIVELKLSCSRVGSMSIKNAPAPSSEATPQGCPAVPSSHERRSSGGLSDDISVHVSADAVSPKQLQNSTTFSKLKKPFRAASKKCLAKLTQAFTPAKSSNKAGNVPTGISVRAKFAMTNSFKLACLHPHVQDEYQSCHSAGVDLLSIA